MDVVLEKIHYNPDCFLKIVEDFEDYVEHTEPGSFWEAFGDLKKSSGFTEEALICEQIITKNMELALAELKKDPRGYLNDFDEIKKMLESSEAEEKVEEWLDELPCHLYTFYHTVIEILWRANWPRYSTALRDIGKASQQSRN